MSSRSEKFPPVCANDDVRKYFVAKGLTYDDITDGDILALVLLLNDEFKKSNKAGETSVDTMRLSSKIITKHKNNGSITECYLFMNSHYFTQRECVSFNKDGFIGLAGWADDQNLNPIRRALLRWIDTLADMKSASDVPPEAVAIERDGMNLQEINSYNGRVQSTITFLITDYADLVEEILGCEVGYDGEGVTYSECSDKRVLSALSKHLGCKVTSVTAYTRRSQYDFYFNGEWYDYEIEVRLTCTPSKPDTGV